MRRWIGVSLLGLGVIVVITLGYRYTMSSKPHSQREAVQTAALSLDHWRTWIQAEKDPDRRLVRLSHVKHLDGAAIRLVGEALRDPSGKIRRWAVWHLGESIEKNPNALPWLIQARHSNPYPSIQDWANSYLHDAASPKIFSSLVRFLNHANPQVRVWAAYAIRKVATRLPEKARVAIHGLERLAYRSGWDEKVAAAAGLHRMATLAPREDEQKRINAALIHLLQAQQWQARRAAIRALGMLGARSLDAVPALNINAQRDTFWYARQEAREAIDQIRADANRHALR
ncbi:MAG: HEAT repeat domain-containing protein [Deltaproteobacteria bacterium]|nr:MAG: HEAT repeat domain-containing protein [Deltaproteobacteria bacterium]